MLRAVAGAAVLAAVLYASLPLWLPKAWLKQNISQDLSDQLGVPVSIGSVSLSWGEGVCIDSLAVANPEGFGAQPLLEVSRVRCDLSPLRMLLRQRLAWLAIESPRMHLALNAARQLNVSKLRPMDEGVQFDRTSVTQAAVTLSLPEDPQRLRLDVADLQMEAGRVFNIGRLTMSASLNQPSKTAPVGLVMLTGPAAGNSKALLEFSFAGLDLKSLGLVQLLDLPLNHLEGLCDGWLQCRVNNDGIVEGVNLRLLTRGLDLEPRMRYRLPRIEQAGLRLSASFDPLSQLVDVDSLWIQLPGLELQGKANFHASFLGGNWMGGRNLELSGKVNPSAVSALFLGRPELPGVNMRINGDVGVNIAYKQVEEQFQARLELDAASASIERPGRVLKPSGEICRGSFSASCSPKTWQFVMDRTELQVGQNEFVSQGALANVRKVVQGWLEGGHGGDVLRLEEELADLDWQGGVAIRDLPSLCRMDERIEAALTGVQVGGSGVAGSWNLSHGHANGTHFDVRLSAAGDSVVHIGDWVAKPDGEAFDLSFASVFDEEARRLREATMKLSAGGTLTVDVTEASSILAADQLSAPLHLEGKWHAEQIEQLRPWVPALVKSPVDASGATEGTFSATIGGKMLASTLQINATNVALAAAPYYRKPAGEAMTLSLGIAHDQAQALLDVSLDAALPDADVRGKARFGPSDWQSQAQCEVKDAKVFLARSALAARCLAGWQVSGPLSLAVQGNGRANENRLTLEAHGKELDLAERSSGRRKSAGTALDVSIKAATSEGEVPGEDAFLLDALQVRLGGSVLELAGSGIRNPQGSFSLTRAQSQLSLGVDQALLEAVPELRPYADAYRPSGQVILSGKVAASGNKWIVAGDIDAKSLSIDGPDLVKNAGTPGTVRWTGSAAADLSSLALTDWKAQLGSVGAMGDLRVELAEKPLSRLKLSKLRSHFRAWVADAADAAQLAPMLAEAQPVGKVDVEGDLQADENDAQLLWATAKFANLSASVAGKRLGIDGTLRGEKVALSGRAERLVGDNLLFTLDDSDLRLAMDLRQFPHAPKGSVTLSSRKLDSAAFRDLAAALSPAPSADAEAMLDQDRLSRQAQEWIDTVRPWALGSDVTVSGRLQRVLNWHDVKVNATYDVSNVALDAAVKQGQTSVRYEAGVNGGTVSERWETKLDAPAPEIVIASGARELLAGKNLQPQVEAFFPGNEVKGSMTRQMQVTAPLKDFVANTMDPRYPLHTVGSGTTTFVEGITRGRAAPTFVTRVFPGLNLVEYQYERMMSFSEFRADGTAYNDMIFSGKKYDMYVEGTTDSKQVGRYEIGLILLGTPQTPEWNHTYRQGRLPILKWQARIVGGKRLDEQVQYPWPNETMFKVFLQNNIVYRLWLASRR